MAHRYQHRHAGPVPARWDGDRVAIDGPQEISVLFAGSLLPHADAPIVTCGHNDDSDVFAIGGDPIAPGLVPDGSVIQPASDLGVPSERFP
jgi:hypothetical protein